MWALPGVPAPKILGDARCFSISRPSLHFVACIPAFQRLVCWWVLHRVVTAVIYLATYLRRMQFWYFLLCLVLSGNPDAYTAQTSPQAASNSKVFLASDPKRDSTRDFCPTFLLRVQSARSKILAMENGRQGWKCVHCRIMNKKNAEYCQKCGGYWTECHEGESRSWTWTASSDSQSSRPRSSSARRRTKPNNSKGKGAGKDPNVKGKSAGKESSTKGNNGKNSSSPFAYVPTSNAMTPWPILDFEQFQQAP